MTIMELLTAELMSKQKFWGQPGQEQEFRLICSPSFNRRLKADILESSKSSFIIGEPITEDMELKKLTIPMVASLEIIVYSSFVGFSIEPIKN